VSVIDDLLVVYERFKAMSPIAVAFWCVDRPDQVWKIRSLIEQEHARSPRPLGILPLDSIPVYEWYSWLVDDDDHAKRPACFSTPGVYAQMNDGTYKAI